jgi:hypothetical protein
MIEKKTVRKVDAAGGKNSTGTIRYGTITIGIQYSVKQGEKRARKKNTFSASTANTGYSAR